MSIVFVGIDLATNMFAVHGVDESGKAALVRPSMSRARAVGEVGEVRDPTRDSMHNDEQLHCCGEGRSDGAFRLAPQWSDRSGRAPARGCGLTRHSRC